MRTNTEPAKADRGAPEPPWLKPLSDYGPISVFFAAYVLADLLWATAALMAATAVALGLSLSKQKRRTRSASVWRRVRHRRGSGTN